MHCTNCGTLMPDNARFCPQCGAPSARFNQAASPPPAPAAPQKQAAAHGLGTILMIAIIGFLITYCSHLASNN
jgi:uncharacterized membrane protein YvbJ